MDFCRLIMHVTVAVVKLLWKHMLGIDAFLQARPKVQGALNPCCRKVSAISNNNSSLNRSAGMQSANECPC